MVQEFINFIIYSGLIILISKYILVTTLRKLAENLDLKPQTVGDIAGYATSMPELLTVTVSSLKGLMGASVINILSSNIINLIQYLFSVILNKNNKVFRNKAIALDLFLVILTIIIPIVFIIADIEINLLIVPLFIILYLFFKFLNHNAHKLYLKKEDEELAKQIKEEEKEEKGNTRKTLIHILVLLITGILLFLVGNELGNTLESLCNEFNIPQFVIGILLGFSTSIPELITFFEAQKHYKKHRKSNEILGVVEATNNLLTSNILNLFIIQSVGIILLNLVRYLNDFNNEIKKYIFVLLNIQIYTFFNIINLHKM